MLFKQFKLDIKLIKDIDKTLLFSMIALVLYGILNIYLCTKGGKYDGFAFKQFVWLIISLVVLYIFLSIDYTIMMNYVPLFYWGSVILLIATMFFGSEINGAKGWIRLGPLSLQASEIAKIGIILMLAKKLDEMDGKINDVKNFFTLVFYTAVPVLFIIIQPDMGMTMVCFFIVLGIFFVAGLDMKIIGGGLASLVIAIIVVINSSFIPAYQKKQIYRVLKSRSRLCW